MFPPPVLVKELQALALDVSVFDDDGAEIDLKQDYDDDEPETTVANEFNTVNDIEDAAGYSIENADEDRDDYRDADGEPDDDDLLTVPGEFVDDDDSFDDFSDTSDFVPDDYGTDEF